MCKELVSKIRARLQKSEQPRTLLMRAVFANIYNADIDYTNDVDHQLTKRNVSSMSSTMLRRICTSNSEGRNDTL